MRRFFFPILALTVVALIPRTASSINPRATLDQLKRLEIICYVPRFGCRKASN